MRASVLTLIVLSACSPSSESPLDWSSVEDSSTPRPYTSAADGSDEGDTLWASYTFPWGVEQVPYRLVDGRRVTMGDVLLPEPSPSVDGAPPPAAPIIGKRWPDGVMVFAFDGTVPTTVRNNVRVAMADIARRSPVSFLERTTETDYVNFTVPSQGNWGRSAIGMVGGHQDLLLGSGATSDLIQHEIFHALGVFHEQSRPDRDLYLDVDIDCVKPANHGDYFKVSGGQGYIFGPYDPTSVMQYDTWQECLKDENDLDGDGVKDECGLKPSNNPAGFETCIPMVYLDNDCPAPFCSDDDRDGRRERLHQRLIISARDLQALHAMYGDFSDTAEPYDRFGYRVRLGDLDGDGFPDLVVSAPGEDLSNATTMGKVFVFRGTWGGFQPWQELSLLDWGVTMDHARFGSALEIGDFDGDGVGDLAVGAAGAGYGGLPFGSGAVFVYTGSDEGLTAWMDLTEDSIGGDSEEHDNFGESLAAGDFDGDGSVDLAVAATNDRLVGDHWTSGFGRVHVVQFSSGVPTRLNLIDQETTDTNGAALGGNEPEDVFGYAMVAGDIDQDGADDLVVGAPGDRPSGNGIASGGAYVYQGGDGGLRGWQQLDQTSYSLGDNEDGDELGFSVALGDLDTDDDLEILVGAPGEELGASWQWDTGTGYDEAGMIVSYDESGGTISGLQSWSQHLGLVTPEEGDRYGHALATVDVGEWVDVLGGTPGKGSLLWGYASDEAGLLYTVDNYPNGTSLRAMDASFASDLGYTYTAGDELGASVDALDHEDCRVKVVSAPGTDDSAGVVYAWSPCWTTWQKLSQDSQGTLH